MQHASFALYALLALAALSFAFKYLRAASFMPYHQTIIGKPWSSVEPRVQAVMVGMLRTIGGGLLVCAVALLWLLWPLHRSESWAAWAATSVVLASSTPTLVVMLSLQRLEPSAKLPIPPTVASILAALLALLLTVAA